MPDKFDVKSYGDNVINSLKMLDLSKIEIIQVLGYSFDIALLDGDLSFDEMVIVITTASKQLVDILQFAMLKQIESHL